MEQHLNLMWIPPLPKLWQTPSPLLTLSLFPLWNMLAFVCTCAVLRRHHLPFISLYRTHKTFSLFVESLTPPPPQPCWLAVFCLLAAVMLLYSPVVIYLHIRPPAIFFSMNSIEELVKAFFFFSSPISGLGRKLSVQHYGLLFANFTILLHSLRGAIRLKRGQGNKRDTRLLNNIKEHTETQQYFVFLQGTLLFKIDVVGLKDSILIFFFLIHYQCLVTCTCLS